MNAFRMTGFSNISKLFISWLLFLPAVCVGQSLYPGIGGGSGTPPPSNDPPVWDSTPTPSALEGTASSYDVTQHYTEPDGDPVTLADGLGCTLPTGVTIDNTNKEIDFSTGTSAGTTANCTLDIDDGTNPAVESSAFSIVITAAAAGDNEAGDTVAEGDECPDVPTSFGATFNSTSEADFWNDYNAASCGDGIFIADGTYDWDTDRVLAKNCSAGNPIYIGYEPVTGNGILRIDLNTSNADYNITGDGHIIAGIRWTTAGPTRLLEFQGSADSRVACNEFLDYQTNQGIVYVDSNGGNDRIEIDNNVFDDWTGIAVNAVRKNQLTNAAFWVDLHIHHNTFSDKLQTGSGSEAIKLGSGHNYIDSVEVDGIPKNKAIVENNLFDNVKGEEEILSVKNDAAIVRYNCVLNSATVGTFVNRSGNYNLIYGNWLDDVKEGIRVGGEENIIAYNYVRNGGGGTDAWRLHYGDYVAATGKYKYKTADTNTIRLNVLANHNYMIENTQTNEGDTDEQPSANIHSDNDYFTDSLVGNNAAGSYKDGTGGLYNEAAWRAANTWGANSVTATDKVKTTCFNAGHFNGPDGTVTVPQNGEYHDDAPATIPEPSWWD